MRPTSHKGDFRTSSPDLLCWVSRDGRYLDVVAGTNVSTVAPTPDIIGRHVLEVGSLNYAEKTWSMVQKTLDTQELQKWDFQIPDRPGITYEARFVVSAPDECMILVRDVSDLIAGRLALEAQVAARTQELQISNDELRQFAYAASHDLREPLLKVKSFGERLKERYQEQLDDRGIQYIDVMLNATDRMQTLMDDLLMYSKAGAPEDLFEDVDLNQVLALVQEDLLIPIQESQAEIEVDPLPHVWANSRQLQTLFQNLISNSVKFCHPERLPHIHVFSTQNQDDLVVTVEDNGIGFGAEYRERIFQIFERLHTRFNYPGTGIGLALCKKIMDRHQGWIEGDGGTGTGATFHVGFPLKGSPK